MIVDGGPVLRGTDGEAVGEPDDDFADARLLRVESSTETIVTGSLSPRSDVDLYDIGPVRPGDRVIVDITDQQGRLDSVVILFDDQFRQVAWNDDRDLGLNLLAPLIDVVVRHESDRFFVGVSALSRGTGAYGMSVRYTPGRFAPDPRPQTILLDFNGGRITLSGERTREVGPFDAADVDESFDGQTDLMKAMIIATLLENFDGLDVRILNTDDDAEPVFGRFSRVLFGGYSSESFGASQSVDLYNENADDEAIIYTEVFTPGIFLVPTARLQRRRPSGGEVSRPCASARSRLANLIGQRRLAGSLTADDMARAIGNVASHEMGHLLGLSHVADPDFLMDTTGEAATLLRDQRFGQAELDETIFPVGYQDSLLLLRETVGTRE